MTTGPGAALRGLRQAGKRLGFAFSEEELGLFSLYIDELWDWKDRMNLVSAAGREEVAQRHFLDSLTCLLAADFPAGARVIDVGSGAGFPGLPLKIHRPDLQVTLLEARLKRARFLEHVVQVTGLQGVEVVAGRAEEVAHRSRFREAFDRAVVRAVGPLAVLVEYCLPFLVTGGLLIAQKSTQADAETREAAAALRELGGRVAAVRRVGLPAGGEGTVERLLVVIEKTRATPARFPRRTGRPAKVPLGALDKEGMSGMGTKKKRGKRGKGVEAW